MKTLLVFPILFLAGQICTAIELDGKQYTAVSCKKVARISHEREPLEMEAIISPPTGPKIRWCVIEASCKFVQTDVFQSTYGGDPKVVNDNQTVPEDRFVPFWGVIVASTVVGGSEAIIQGGAKWATDRKNKDLIYSKGTFGCSMDASVGCPKDDIVSCVNSPTFEKGAKKWGGEMKTMNPPAAATGGGTQK